MNKPAEKSIAAETLTDGEIKDAHVIFNDVWKALLDDVDVEELRFPKEIILLGGAPGAGKGTNTEFIMKARGFTCPTELIGICLFKDFLSRRRSGRV